jgi:hypothetical protein
VGEDNSARVSLLIEYGNAVALARPNPPTGTGGKIFSTAPRKAGVTPASPPALGEPGSLSPRSDLPPISGLSGPV